MTPPPTALLGCRTLLVQHMGLGDALICNAATRHFVHTCEGPVGLFIEPRFRESIEFMYRDLGDRLRLIDAPKLHPPAVRWHQLLDWGHALPLHLINMSMFQENWPYFKGEEFDQSFYRFAGLPIEDKFDGFLYDRCPEREHPPIKQPYSFIHDDAKRYMTVGEGCLPDMWLVRPDPERWPNIFDWRGVIENAKEVHVINSSFLNFVDLACKPSGKLVWHYYSRIWEGKSDPTLQLNWKIIT